MYSCGERLNSGSSAAKIPPSAVQTLYSMKNIKYELTKQLLSDKRYFTMMLKLVRYQRSNSNSDVIEIFLFYLKINWP